MSIIDHIRGFDAELIAIRHTLHQSPEIGMKEYTTSKLVAEQLKAWGLEVHEGVGGTGVVGVLRSGNRTSSIGLRADMDALPMPEADMALPYRSRNDGVMHACGHDGHTTMLLGAARYLSETRNFDGVVNFIFQPGEEGMGGALAMIQDRLFERFPCQSLFALHNRPGKAVGQFSLSSGKSNAGGAFFDIVITGKGSHGAAPDAGIDPVLTACHLGTALQSIVSRNIKASEPVVLSVTRIVAGDAYNVIPSTATLSGTARAFTRETMAQLEEGIKRVTQGVAAAFGAKAEVDFRFIFAPLINDAQEIEFAGDVAEALVGAPNVERQKAAGMGSEDFAFMLEHVPGAYLHVGNGEASAPLHNINYNFDDSAIPYGAAFFALAAERKLARETDD